MQKPIQIMAQNFIFQVVFLFYIICSSLVQTIFVLDPDFSIVLFGMTQKLLGKKIKSFNILKILGQGAFATVFQAFDDKTSSIVAVKVLPLSSLKRPKLRELVQTQISVLKACKNQNVISYIDSFETSEFMFLVTQFCNGGDLQQHIQQQNIPEGEAVVFLKQILNGFKGLHEVGAMHRDFKAANVLLHDGVCKIADLGFSKQMGPNSITTTVLGTSLTMAPQILQQTQYDFSADIWSIGVVFYHMIYGTYPFMATNDFLLLKRIKSRPPNYDGINISKNSKDFIQKCLTVDRAKRITWKQIYEHPLICQKQKRTLTPGVLKSRLSYNQNRSFYENVTLKNEERSQKAMQSLIMITMQVLPDDNLKELQKMESLMQRAEKIKQKEEITDKFDNLYIGRRNDLMFFAKFIQPYLSSFEHIRANHAVMAFLLCKKSYIQLTKVHESMKSNSPVFFGQSGFQQYCNSESYKKVMAQIYQDIQTMGTYCMEYKARIKLTTKQIQSELNRPAKLKNANYDGFLSQLIGDYIRLLGESMDYVQGQAKINMLMTIQALHYYKGNPKPHAYEFERIISTTNFIESQNSLVKKCGLR